MPLSAKGLCDAEIMTPRSARIERVSIATAGVGIGPSSTTSMPTLVKPATIADSIMYPDSRVSLPITTRWRWSPRRKCAPAACPTRSAVSAVIGSILVVPRIPSVPKNLRVMVRTLARLTDPAPDSCRNGVNPGGDQEQYGAADERDRAGISEAAGEGDERRLRGPFVPRFAHEPRFLPILSEGPGKRDDDDGCVKYEAFRLSEDHQVNHGPDREAPHHRVTGDGEDPVRSPARPPCSNQCRIADERADEQDRREPHQDRTGDPADVARVPKRRLAPALVIEVDHRSESDQRDERIETAKRPLAHSPDQRPAERVRQKEVRAKEGDARQQQGGLDRQCL